MKSKYFLFNQETKEKVPARCLKKLVFLHLPGIQFFLSRGLPEDVKKLNYKFVVSEKSTGGRVSAGETMKEAVENAYRILGDVDPSRMKEVIAYAMTRFNL